MSFTAKQREIIEAAQNNIKTAQNALNKLLANTETELSDEVLVIELQDTVDRAWSKLRFAVQNDFQYPSKTTWAEFRRELVDLLPPAMFYNLKSAKQLFGANFDKAERRDDSYSYCAKAGVSVQNQDNNKTWDSIVKICKYLHLTVEMRYQWFDKPEVQKDLRGQIAKTIITP